MKPFQLIVLTVFGLLALLGLTLFATFGGFGGSGDKVGEVTIWGTLPQGVMEAQVQALKQSDAAYAAVTYVEVPEIGFDQNLAEALASGSGPNLVLMSQEHLVAQRNKIRLIPYDSIPERTYLDTYAPITELYLTAEGTYGIPFVIDPLMLFYNRTALTSAGIGAAPASWEAVTGLAEKLTVLSAGQVVKPVVPFGAYENVGTARAILSLLLFQSGTPITADNGGGIRSVFASSDTTVLGGLTPQQSALNFYTQFADPAKTIYTWNSSLPSARQAFASGDLVLYPGFASELPIIQATNPSLDFDIAAMPQPGGTTNRITYGLVYAFSIPISNANPDGAFLAASALSSANISASAVASLSMAPATRAGITQPQTDKYRTLIYPQALAARGWLSPTPAATDQAFGTMIRSMTSGRSGTAEAIQAASVAIDSQL